MKVKFSVGTNYVGSDRTETIEITDAELEGMTEAKIEEYIEEIFQAWVWENIESYWVKVG